MSFGSICFIVHGIIKQLLNAKFIKVVVILWSRAFDSNHHSSFGIDNCEYHKTLIPNDCLLIYMIFIIKAYNLFWNG